MKKALEGAAILAGHLGLAYTIVEDLGEIDRSATGYLEPAELAVTVSEFYAFPERSACGWETARAAQQRMTRAMEFIIGQAPAGRDVAVVAHGMVGALYLCLLKGCAIHSGELQPGPAGGHSYCFDRQTRALVHGWQAIDG